MAKTIVTKRTIMVGSEVERERKCRECGHTFKTREKPVGGKRR